ncbi:MAG: thioesterase family protein [Bryobacteraceae bacterium]|jgi:acyl-CoA thioester hydrolase
MKHESLSEFPLVIGIPVQWGDQDAYGHVNNTVYLRWCESVRIEYLRRIGLWAIGDDGIGPILASISCDYRRPLTYPDTVYVGVRVEKIGNSSFRMDHVVVSEAQKLVAAEVRSTIVVVDYRRNKSVPVPEPVLAAIEKIEGRVFERAAAVR